MKEYSKYIEYQLLFNSIEATFKPEKVIAIENADDDIEIAMLHVGGTGERYYSIENNISLWKHDAFGKKVILVDTLKSDDWRITNETKMIKNFKVKKATIKKTLYNNKTIEVVAWFTPDLPVSFGPVGYNGLPGLILEFHAKDFVIYAASVKLSKKSYKIKKPSKATYMGKTAYNKFLKKAAKNFLNN